VFNDIDENHNGALSKEEFCTYMEKHAPQFQNWDKHFNFLDTSHSGSLSFPQFKAGALNREYLLSDENLEAVFNILDTKKTGYLKYEDM
jgi:Ca2+-binding EF-hand superfamily protein